MCDAWRACDGCGRGIREPAVLCDDCLRAQQPAPTWQPHLFDGGADSLASQGELFGRHEYTDRPRREPEDPDQLRLFAP
jgi:hypothetical protein